MNQPKLPLCALPGLLLIEMNCLKNKTKIKKKATHNANVFVTGVDSAALKFGLALGLASFETYTKEQESERAGPRFTWSNVIYSVGIMKAKLERDEGFG